MTYPKQSKMSRDVGGKKGMMKAGNSAVKAKMAPGSMPKTKAKASPPTMGKAGHGLSPARAKKGAAKQTIYGEGKGKRMSGKSKAGRQGVFA